MLKIQRHSDYVRNAPVPLEMVEWMPRVADTSRQWFLAVNEGFLEPRTRRTTRKQSAFHRDCRSNTTASVVSTPTVQGRDYPTWNQMHHHETMCATCHHLRHVHTSTYRLTAQCGRNIQKPCYKLLHWQLNFKNTKKNKKVTDDKMGYWN